MIVVKKWHSHPTPDYYNNETDYVYIFKLDKLPKKLQKEEVEAVEFMPLSRFEEELKNPQTAKKFVPHKYLPELIEIIRKELAS